MSGRHCPGDALSALLDGELAPAEAAAVRAHAATCSTCRVELSALEGVRALVRSLPALDLPPGLVERVRWVDRRRASRVAGVVAAAVAAAASLAFVAAAPTDPVTPPVDRLVEMHATSGVNGEPLTQLVPIAVPVSFRE